MKNDFCRTSECLSESFVRNLEATLCCWHCKRNLSSCEAVTYVKNCLRTIPFIMLHFNNDRLFCALSVCTEVGYHRIQSSEFRLQNKTEHTRVTVTIIANVSQQKILSHHQDPGWHCDKYDKWHWWTFDASVWQVLPFSMQYDPMFNNGIQPFSMCRLKMWVFKNLPQKIR